MWPLELPSRAHRSKGKPQGLGTLKLGQIKENVEHTTLVLSVPGPIVVVTSLLSSNSSSLMIFCATSSSCTASVIAC